MQSEEQKVQELLKPRVKVVAPWPEMERWLARVGDILTDPGGNETVRNQNGDAVPAFEWETFPHLFRKLEWWEERDTSEMPQYVKWDYKRDVDHENMEHHIAKVEGWQQENFGVITNGQVTATKFWLPATSAEYTVYIEKQPTIQNQGI